MEKVIDKLVNFAVDAAGNIVFAILIIIVGFKISKIIIKLIQKGRGFNKLEKSVQTFIVSFLNISLKVIVLISACTILGVPMTSVITIIGSFGLALGLALQGGLSNIAGSLMILIFKPFKVGDYIETPNHSGTVHEISLFHTVLKTVENKTVVIPNGKLSNEPITNLNTLKKVRLALKFSVSYSSDIDKVKKIIEEVIKGNDKVLKDEEIFVRMVSHADSALVFESRCWTESVNYFNLKFDLLEDVKKAFDKNKIQIPFPQVDVHLDKE